MAQSLAKRRRRIKRKLKSMKIPRRILNMTLVILGFIVAILLGILAGKTFGAKMVVDGSSMEPTIEANATVRVNKLIYKIRKPVRMDLIVFDMGKSQTNRYFVRRVVGLPGETIQITDGVIYINDEPVKYKYSEEYLVDAGLAASPIKLGIDEYFVLGDNYNNCDDSRFGSIATIAKKQIVGKAG